MAQAMVTQGRNISGGEIALIRDLMARHRDWGRTRLSEELCRCWNWRNAQGRIKDMAARTLLLKLERRGCIELPPRQRPSTNQNTDHLAAKQIQAFETRYQQILDEGYAQNPLPPSCRSCIAHR